MPGKRKRQSKKRRKGGHSITIRGNKKYVSRMSKHLKKEHPSTRKRMTIK